MAAVVRAAVEDPQVAAPAATVTSLAMVSGQGPAREVPSAVSARVPALEEPLVAGLAIHWVADADRHRQDPQEVRRSVDLPPLVAAEVVALGDSDVTSNSGH